MLLYTSFLHSCSPLRCGDHFAPIPLYRLPAVANGDHKQIIKWQEDWEACDQLQMNGSIAEHAALHEIGEVGSRLHRRGSDLARRLELLSGIPTYYYLYRVGGLSAAEERARPCPGCGGPWALAAPCTRSSTSSASLAGWCPTSPGTSRVGAYRAQWRNKMAQ